jgi:hypothetical protein
MLVQAMLNAMLCNHVNQFPNAAQWYMMSKIVKSITPYHACALLRSLMLSCPYLFTP